jgi:hypothetical protein
MSSLQDNFRWGAWAGGVLARVENPEGCLAEIVRRQEAVDDDAEEADLVAAEFRERLRKAGHDPDRACVFIPSKQAAEWLKAATGTHRATNRATAYLDGLHLPQMARTKKDDHPGWRWRGPLAPEGATMTRLKG